MSHNPGYPEVMRATISMPSPDNAQSPRDHLEALRDADFVGIPREALIASIHDLARQLLTARDLSAGSTPISVSEVEMENTRLREGLRQIVEEDYPAEAGTAQVWASEVLADSRAVGWQVP